MDMKMKTTDVKGRGRRVGWCSGENEVLSSVYNEEGIYVSTEYVTFN